jgi:hypothetical protein
MPKRIALSLAAVLCHVSTLLAFDARYAPQTPYAWPAPDGVFDRAASVFDHPVLPDTQFLVGEVVNQSGTIVPTLTRLNNNGEVIWSKGLPNRPADGDEGLALIDDNHLLVSYTLQEGPEIIDFLGSFDPGNNFAPHYTKQLSPSPFDPNNTTRVRTIQAQRSGRVAVVELAGANLDILMLDETATPMWAKSFLLPADGGGLPFPIPGLGIRYLFAIVVEADDGSFSVALSGVDIFGPKAVGTAIKMSSAGALLWQRHLEFPGNSSILFPRPDGSFVMLSSGADQDPLRYYSSTALLGPDGTLQMAADIEGAILSEFSFSHFDAAGTLLLSGTIPTSAPTETYTADGALLILSTAGEKLAEVAYDAAEVDIAFHQGTDDNALYFDFFGFQSLGVVQTFGVLAKCDANLENWVARSYLETLGPSASLSSFFFGNSTPYIAHRDEPQDWISVSRLDANLQEVGECAVLQDFVMDFYDPDLVVSTASPTIQDDVVSMSEWEDAPSVLDATFSLIDVPLIVENVCGSGNGLWAGITPANDKGDKLAGFGWINDSQYPFVYLYSINGYLYILDEFSALFSIYAWDTVNEFWLWTADAYGGWYFNLSDPNWGTGGWANWGG